MQSLDTLAGEGPDSLVEQFSSGDVGGQYRTHLASTPGELLGELPLTEAAAGSVSAGRLMTRRVLSGDDDRLLVVVGPCSIHDVNAGLAYARSLGELAAELADDLAVVMRVYVEKPRTTVGWTGLLADPALDGNPDLDRGLRTARALMLEVAELGLPIATEWLSPAAPAYLADLISWGAIGARTVESQVHRQLASGLPMPVGMKNGSTGSVGVAVDAIRSAAAPHAYLGLDRDGRPVTLRTSGNPDCHVVLRGASGQPNYRTENVRSAARLLSAASLPTGLVIDASHGNSGKDHDQQALVAREIGAQIAAGDTDIRGVMLEGFLIPGRQELGVGEPVFGQSITDACMGWDATVDVLRDLAAATRRRALTAATG
ncbi:3-deoxy-7-phosphoheptulonate synthase [Streptomyces durmitorensis]|uniref:Phospho-2-dehydro-3-deoxyheptonate aldolase n=1 Tax=Streptomyces durmitorensis TaxID=319947 RepID=A0ABY4PQ86_9ACTN|nr:3-deoxy-7-phosphoheptulonate synthase [Streptomyces durmitorensis]UQT55965.1 3-deoxy-7-phosphoheptulonate synthase [Streptomyces durmitorensis]